MDVLAKEGKLARKTTSELHHSGSAKSISDTLKWPVENSKSHKYHRSIDLYPPLPLETQSERKDSTGDTDGGYAEDHTDSSKSRSVDQPEHSEMSVHSQTSGSRYSLRSFNSCTEDIKSKEKDSVNQFTKVLLDKKVSLEFGHRKNYVYISTID